MGKWLREPLLYFAVAGVLVFAVDTFRQKNAKPQEPKKPPQSEFLTEARKAILVRDFERKYKRKPSARELQREVDHWLDEEVLVRRARQLGLDKHDIIVRRRLAQGMRYLLVDVTPLKQPTEADLQRWLDKHPERYRLPVRVSLKHIFFDRDKRKLAARVDALAALASRRKSTSKPAQVGDPFFRGSSFANKTKKDLIRVFGAPWTETVMKLKPGTWQGPFSTVYGEHLVLVTSRTLAQKARLAQVRKRVSVDWQETRRKAANRNALDTLRRRFGLRPAAVHP